ncbi:unnamed protein product (macronuclear) [Paramecium tetraurelia]|uniref:Uncharacterized protein n=1 Tax=Paramecium tetraurelia TaxID=5888 RepID=A0D054_PARTE|nr:uncharacterized protein GSPATT00011973001 [Paramecium tetraurelia]CAK76421.1 unnamed protein product [Paramecium tetraurelia]|eukprot:XP_001443818.1 hypothetical protein (macronuclear) [Paramecium tetraurelia strain d4-2]
MDSMYSKYIIPNQSEKKQSSSPHSQVTFNNIQVYIFTKISSNFQKTTLPPIVGSASPKTGFKNSRILSNFQVIINQATISKASLSILKQELFNQSQQQMKQTQLSIDINKKEQQEFQEIKDDQIIQTNTIIDSPTKMNTDDSPKKNKFKAFGNLLLSIRRLQQNLVERISNIDQLKESIIKPSTNTNASKIHPDPSSRDSENINEILSNLKLVDRFIYYSEQGSQNDIQKMIKLLQIYPKKHLYCPTDPKHILNSFNKFGQNSLYISCKNGNIAVIKFLLDQQANPFIKSKVYENFYESPLEVSIRWNHFDCVQLLLEKSNYSNKELKAAIQQTSNPQIKQLIKSNLKSDTFCCY